MKEFFKNLLVLIFAILFSVLMFTIGSLYSLIKIVVISIKKRNIKILLKYIWNIIDGYLAAIGYMFGEMAYTLDVMWNVNGEIIEDIVTKEGETEFGKKNTPVSASVGKLQIEGKLSKSGKNVSNFLNYIFWEKNHAVDSWNYMVAKKALRSNFFERKDRIGGILIKITYK